MQKDNELIALCCTMVEKSLLWGDSAHWTNQDFEALSERIFTKTHVNLSVSTLKRIWGKVKYNSTPTQATLNALAMYLDYGSWRDFQVAHAKTQVPVASEPNKQADNTPPQKGKQKYALVMMTSLVLVAASVMLLVSKDKTPDYGQAVFKSHKASDDLPNSVVFNYDASAFDADSVFIQQNWDPRRRERVPTDGKQHTSIYFRPGYFQAKLIINDDLAKEDVVFIRTKGWRGIVDGKPIPAYLLDDEMRMDGALGIASATMREKTSVNVFNEVWVNFYNVNEFGVPGNAFEFETTLRNTSPIGESVCRKINITLLTKGSAIVIPLGPPGCISSLDMLTPNGWMEGKENDMRAFGCDVGQFQTVRVKNDEGEFSIALNGNVIYNEQVKYRVGDIAGIRIGFEGTGEIATVKLAGGGNLAVDDDFRSYRRSTPGIQ